MAKHFLIMITHSLKGQDGVSRMKKDYREEASSPEVALKRAMSRYRRDTTKGKRGVAYIAVVKQLGTV